MEAQQIADRVMALARVEAVQIGRLLASRKDSDLFGQTEFILRVLDKITVRCPHDGLSFIQEMTE